MKKKKKDKKINEQEIAQNNYSENVKTKENSTIYIKKEGQYIDAGQISKNVELHLNKVDNVYYQIDSLDQEYYINYKDVEKIDKLAEKNQRYKKYIVWNKNIITKEKTNFYNEKDELQFTINKSYNIPIIIDDKDKYYVEYDNRLLYIKKEDIEKIIDNTNTTEINTPGIPVLNYHFVYKTEECNQEICTSEKQFRQHME